VILALVSTVEAGEVTLWHAYRGDERTALEKLAAEYGDAHPGTTVLPVFVPFSEMTNKVEAAVPHGNGPDLFIFAHERIAGWAAEGIIRPASPGGDYTPVAIDALTREGKVWGWPLALKSLALFYNRALVATPPADTDALVATAKALDHDGKWGLVYEISSAYANACWLHGYGGGVFRGPDVKLDSPENASALGFIRTLADGVVPEETSGALVTQLFNEGRAAMVLNGASFLGEIAPGVDYGVAPLPVVTATGKPAAPYMTVEAVFLARDNPEAAGFAAFLASDAAARIRMDEGRQVVPNTGVPVTDPVLAAFRAQAEHAVPIPTDPAMAQTWEPLARALRRLVRGAVTPEEAVAEAQAHYAVIARPPAQSADTTPWLTAAVLALAGTAVWLRREIAAAPIRRWAFAYAWVAPAFGAMTLLTVIPFVVGAAVSLFEYQEQSWTFVGTAHFLDILLARDFPLTSPLSFWYTLLVTVAWTLANVVLHVGIGLALALLLREPWVRLRGAFRALLILPWAIPSYITALVWKGMFHRQLGAINGVLALLGIEPVSWFSRFSTAFAANVTTNTWLGFPFMMVVTLGALQAIPRDLEEAAEVDGASAWQRFRHVTLPLLSPALLPAVILGSVWTFNMFNVIYLVSGGEPDGSTDILVSQAYRWAFTRGHRYGYAAAYAVIIFGVLVIYGRVANRLAGRKVV
jgi:arabinogalactan oligomer/maltooligosaccharide transport system permease protein